MSTRRVTRSATGALKELDKNVTAVPFANEQAGATGADDKSVPVSKRTAATKMESAAKRKKATRSTKAAMKSKAIIAKRGWALPHGMGTETLTADNVAASPGHTEAGPSSAAGVGPAVSEDSTPAQTNKGKDVPMDEKANIAITGVVGELPAAAAREAPKRPPRRAATKQIKFEDADESDEDKMDDINSIGDKGNPDFKPRSKRGTTNKYGLTRGYSPYPHRTVPTPEQCEEVHRILVETHGAVIQPPKAPPPSIKVTGCGEVPSVLDALLRTRISANTLMENSNRAIEQLAETYGLAADGVGTGSIDWNAVRLGSTEKLANAIRVAGTPKLKAGHIKTILDMVHEEQKARAHALIEGEPVPGAQNEDDGQMTLEVKNAIDDYLSLEHMRAMTADEAISEFVKYPGIAVKTAACVVLFCLQIPCFAVDTHVHKMCKWLGWVPEKANETDTFNHGEHTVPDHLKYALHQLFIRHGQDCFKCRKNTRPGTKAWIEAPDCPLEHLLDRDKAVAKKGEDADEEEEGAPGEDGEVDNDAVDKNPKTKRGKGTKKVVKAKLAEEVDVREESGGHGNLDKAKRKGKSAQASKKASTTGAKKKRSTAGVGQGQTSTVMTEERAEKDAEAGRLVVDQKVTRWTFRPRRGGVS